MFKALKGLVAGLIAGTAVGLLFSPKKGSEIRKDFKKELKGGGVGLNTAKDTLGEMGRDIGGTVKDGYANIPADQRRKAEHVVHKAADRAKKVLKDVKHKIVGK